MDHFGIGQAMQGMARIYIQSSRRSGRTTSLVESLKDGDRVCCATQREAKLLHQLLVERGLNVECIAVDPMSPGRLRERGISHGRTVFDHTWVEQYYIAALQRCQEEIDHLQQHMSGSETHHIETHRQSDYFTRWNVG